MLTNKINSKTKFSPFMRNVKIDSLEPRQQKTDRRFKISADIYQQSFLKFSGIGVFHSYHELLYAGLLESNPDITYFVPQPYKFLIGKRRYTPDFFYIKKGKHYVIEVKPKGELKDETLIPISTYLSAENIKFKVVSNEKIRAKEQLAKNWLQIVRVLKSAENLDTTFEEKNILDQCIVNSKKLIGDFINPFSRDKDFKNEIAIYRLAHSGKVSLDIKANPINFNSEVTSCR